MEFERYGLRLDPKPPTRGDVSSKVRSTAELVANPTPRNLGELLWRLSLPISALLLALLAIPLSSMNPRVGRSINLGLALLIYVIYNNLSSVAQAWVAQGRVDFWLAVWPVHLLLALVVVTFFYARVAPRGMRLRLRGAN
jgi:lipopolysaccharide export system permease protein